MKKILWIVFAFGVCTYFGYSAITSRNARLDKERRQITATKAIQETVLRMVQRNGAIDDWDTELTKGDDIGIAPVMTIDLERLWLQEKPIMFGGIISDIRTFDNQYYTVTIDRNPYFNNKVLFFPSELRLELRAEKNVIDSFITRWPHIKTKDALDNGVAVIAKIATIRSDVVSTQDNLTDHISTGEGQLVDLAYTGDVAF